MTVTSYREHGSEIILKQNVSAGRLTSFIVMIMLNISLFPAPSGTQSSLQVSLSLPMLDLH